VKDIKNAKLGQIAWLWVEVDVNQIVSQFVDGKSIF
jgi:hypothetical protein